MLNQNIKALFVIGLFGIIVATLLIGLGNALMPLLIAFGLAYLSFPLIQWLEKRKIRRHYAVVGVFAVIVATWALTLVLVLPGLIEDTRLFFKELPQSSATAIDKVEHLFGKFGFDLQISQEGLKNFLIEHASEVSGDFVKSSAVFLKGLFSNFIGVLLMILNLFLIPLFYFHLVDKYESISTEARDLVPISWRAKVHQYSELVNTVLSGYIRGQMLVSLILATLYGIGFSLVGLRFGLFIGISTGLLSIIPFVGSILGFCAAMIVALANFTGIETVMGVALVFAVVQGLEGLVITPKLVGNKVGLGVLSTMLALIVGGNIFGFAGMIVAIPVAAILKSVIQDLKKEYRELKFYKY